MRRTAEDLIFFRSPFSVRVAFAMAAVLLIVYLFAPTNANPFIYFQF